MTVYMDDQKACLSKNNISFWDVRDTNVINVSDTNDNFHFLGIDKKLPPVLLQIEVALLNKSISISFKRSRLIIRPKILKAEALLSN